MRKTTPEFAWKHQENHEKSHNSRCPSQDSNQAPPGDTSGALLYQIDR
jgi:hypothetical protein